MKKVKFLTGWTDYPFVELGDTPHEVAPIRHVNVLEYDGNNYVKCQIGDTGFVLSFKRAYLYSHKGRLGQVRQINRRKLERFSGHSTKE